MNKMTRQCNDFWQRNLRSCVRSILCAGLLANTLWLSGCAWLVEHQRLLVYRPTPGVPATLTSWRSTDERYFLPVPSSPSDTPSAVAAQQIEIWWLPHSNPQAPSLLYFHGTLRNLYQNQPKIDALREAGFAVMAVDYRGWGASTVITPSEQSIVLDADTAWQEFQRREPRASHRVVYGHSMGSAVAVDVASKLRGSADMAGVILESAFTSFYDVANAASFWGGLIAALSTEQFASIDKIHQLTVPLLMMHGAKDATIPAALGAKLFTAAQQTKRKRWVLIGEGDHSDLQRADAALYQRSLQEFQRELGVKP